LWTIAKDLSEQEGFRFGELWLPINAVLKLAEVEEEEIAEIKEYCERQFSQVRYELSEWDYKLVSIVKDWDGDVATAEDLLSQLCLKIDGDIKPGKQWLGKAIKRLGLAKEKIGGKHSKTTYRLDKEQAMKLLGQVGIIGESDIEKIPF
jgi:hypothetical protein